MNLVWEDVGGSVSSDCLVIRLNCLKIGFSICLILKASSRRTGRMCGFHPGR
jgi:hypothetical protein